MEKRTRRVSQEYSVAFCHAVQLSKTKSSFIQENKRKRVGWKGLGSWSVSLQGGTGLCLYFLDFSFHITQVGMRMKHIPAPTQPLEAQRGHVDDLLL